jgi:hypothetical protein
VIKAAKEHGEFEPHRDHVADRGAGKPRAPRPCSGRILEAELEECGVMAIRRHLLPHKAEIKGRDIPKKQR